MKIEIWSDFACPFCYIGKRRFENGLNKFEYKNNVEIIYRGFQLDFHAEKNSGKDIHAILSEKHGVTYAHAKVLNAEVAKQAEEVGLNYQFDTIIPTNTFDAHRLANFARENGKMKEITERILKAYFIESLDIGSIDTLVKLGEEVGLNTHATKLVLSSNRFSKEVREAKYEAEKLGISGVPFFIINNKYTISGAQSSELFLKTLESVWKKEQLLLHVKEKSSLHNHCLDSSCQI